MQPIKNLKIKYPKFCFMDIIPNKNLYYDNNDEAIKNFNIAKIKLLDIIGKDKFLDLTETQLYKKIIDKSFNILLISSIEYFFSPNAPFISHIGEIVQYDIK